MKTILEKWQISAEELTKIVEENPSLRGFIFGYVSEYKARSFVSVKPSASTLRVSNGV